MDVILIELLLWAALFVMFWAMKDSLTQVENDIDALRLMRRRKAQASAIAFVLPERMSDPIGTYQDAVIYSYAVIDGRKYQFDHVRAPRQELEPDQCCISPGLIYVRCD